MAPNRLLRNFAFRFLFWVFNFQPIVSSSRTYTPEHVGVQRSIEWPIAATALQCHV